MSLFAYRFVPYAERGEATCMLGGSGHAPSKFFFKMVQFDAFWSVFCYNFVKIFIFIKIKDTVLLRTIFRGSGSGSGSVISRILSQIADGAYSPECLFIV